jgi:hypothetical protein
VKVAVIGCGPAGLAAAHAAVGLGADVRVYAPKVKTPQRGPLLIQRAIPGINTGHPDGTIHQKVIGGSILDYRYKLYGDVNIGINGDILKPYYHAWRHGETYDRLWGMYQDLIVPVMIAPSELEKMHYSFDLVVSTANASRMCQGGSLREVVHNFESATVYVTQDYSYPGQPDNTIIFNAGLEYPWVRSSRVFGVGSTEWKRDSAPEGAIRIQKPISTNCNCYPHVLRTGRFGKWRNETWVDTAYWETYEALESMSRQGDLEAIT